MDLAAPTSTAAAPLRDWIVRHDDSRAFVILYVVLALVLSLAVGLFWLVALVAVHLAFEYVRARHHGLGRGAAVGDALWELKLDVALVLFALVLVLYLQFVFGVLGLQAVGRAGALARAGVRGARFAAWENTIRNLLITADDMARGARAVLVIRKQAAGGVPREAPPAPAAGVRQTGTGDYLSLAFGGVCLLLVVLAPWMGYDGWSAALSALAAELHPLPWRAG
jgi:hypothetical protein